MATLVHLRSCYANRCFCVVDPRRRSLQIGGHHDSRGLRSRVFPGQRTSRRQRNCPPRTVTVRADDVLLQARWNRRHVLSHLHLQSGRSPTGRRVNSYQFNLKSRDKDDRSVRILKIFPYLILNIIQMAINLIVCVPTASDLDPFPSS